MAIRISKVYTRTGDKGKTRLVGGAEVDKNDPRVEAYGTIDELNSVIGVVVAHLTDDPRCADIVDRLIRTQQTLFDVGSSVATPSQTRQQGMPAATQADIDALEHDIDHLNESLPILKSFILPSGGVAAATLHVARTVCRRAERQLIEAMAIDQQDPLSMPYVNRLSDYLFVASRAIAARQKIEETLWDPKRNSR